jgi:hypothetical protein
MCSTVPPVLIGFCCAAAAKLTGTKFLYHCMDLYPEIGRISGEFKNKFIYQFLLFLDKQTCRLSNRVIVLSQDMKQSLAARGLDNRKIDILNNFPINDASKPPDGDVNPLLKPNGKFRVLFAGNIGIPGGGCKIARPERYGRAIENTEYYIYTASIRRYGAPTNSECRSRHRKLVSRCIQVRISE